MQRNSKLELFYQIVKIHEFLKYTRSRASKALPLDDLSEAVSAYYQEVVWHPRCIGEFLIHCGMCKLTRNGFHLKSSCLHVEEDGDVLNSKPREYLHKFIYQVR